MRKGAILIGLAAFCLAVSVLMRFYAYPTIARIPPDVDVDIKLTANNARWFDAATGKPARGTVNTTERVTADRAKSKELTEKMDKSILVMDIGRASIHPGAVDAGGQPAPPIFAYTQRVAIDGVSGNVVTWEGNKFNGQKRAVSGHIIKFPFDTQKDGKYGYYDPMLRKEVPLKYGGTKKVNGLTVYVFSHHIPRTKILSQAVPGELFGKSKGAVDADLIYSNTRTLYVEPSVGVIIDADEKEYDTLEVAGKKPVLAMDAHSKFTQPTIEWNSEQVTTRTSKLAVLRWWGPLAFGVAGLLGLAAGVWVGVIDVPRRRRPSTD